MYTQTIRAHTHTDSTAYTYSLHSTVVLYSTAPASTVHSLDSTALDTVQGAHFVQSVSRVIRYTVIVSSLNHLIPLNLFYLLMMRKAPLKVGKVPV